MKKELETYNKVVRCENCEHVVDLKIPMGKPLKTFLQKEECPHCRCFLRTAHPNIIINPVNPAGTAVSSITVGSDHSHPGTTEYGAED